MTTKAYWLYRWSPPRETARAVVQQRELSEEQRTSILRLARSMLLQQIPSGQGGLSLGNALPFVFEESAFYAKRAAVRVVQQQLEPSEPIDPEHMQVQRVDMPLRWCSPHDQGSCVLLYAKSQEEAKSWIGQENVRTICSHYVHEVEKVELALPTCQLCVAILMNRYAEEPLKAWGKWPIDDSVKAISAKVKAHFDGLFGEEPARATLAPKRVMRKKGKRRR